MFSRSRRVSARALSVRLVDDEDVGDLEQAGFAGLDGVPPAGGHHHDRGVGRAGDLHLHLAHADGLNQDGPPAGGSQHADRRGSGDGQPALVAPGGHRPDEHPVVQGVPLHADAVAQNGATREGRRRIHREDADPTPPARTPVMTRAVRVDFPAPGAPVMPMTCCTLALGAKVILLTSRAGSPPRSTSERSRPSAALSPACAAASSSRGSRRPRAGGATLASPGGMPVQYGGGIRRLACPCGDRQLRPRLDPPGCEPEEAPARFGGLRAGRGPGRAARSAAQVWRAAP